MTRLFEKCGKKNIYKSHQLELKDNELSRNNCVWHRRYFALASSVLVHSSILELLNYMYCRSYWSEISSMSNSILFLLSFLFFLISIVSTSFLTKFRFSKLFAPIRLISFECGSVFFCQVFYLIVFLGQGYNDYLMNSRACTSNGRSAYPVHFSL